MKTLSTDSIRPSQEGAAADPSEWARALSAQMSAESLARTHEPVARRTTLRVGGTADLFVEPASEDDLGTALRFFARQSIPWMILGRGSNLLVLDGGIRGAVVSLARGPFSTITLDGERIRAGAGARLKILATEARRAGLAGLEFFEGIPGSVGGALRMNAGAMGSSAFAVAETVRVMDLEGRIEERRAAELGAVYRRCAFLQSHVALAGVFRGTSDSAEAIADRMKRYSQKRWATQPATSSAGCMFKNPESIPAGQLIDQLKLKGARRGRAMISELHGNFIVNLGGATARDVCELIALVRERARDERGVELATEVEIVGEPLAPEMNSNPS